MGGSHEWLNRGEGRGRCCNGALWCGQVVGAR